MTELTDEEKREVYRRAASNMGITEEQARQELEEMAGIRNRLEAQVKRLEKLLQEVDSRDTWTVDGKSPGLNWKRPWLMTPKNPRSHSKQLAVDWGTIVPT